MRIRTKRHELIITPGKCISETREFKTDMRDRRKIHSGRTSRSWTVGIWKRLDDDYDIMIDASQLAMLCNNNNESDWDVVSEGLRKRLILSSAHHQLAIGSGVLQFGL